MRATDLTLRLLAVFALGVMLVAATGCSDSDNGTTTDKDTTSGTTDNGGATGTDPGTTPGVDPGTTPGVDPGGSIDIPGVDTAGIDTAGAGQNSFFSAAQGEGQGAYGDRNAMPTADNEAGGGEHGADAVVEEGDIYRVLADNRILNLNSYRGLQVIDVADTANPSIIGRLKVTGTPVEMYVVNNQAIVLLNNWRGYYGEIGVPGIQNFEGGLVLLVDLSDPTAPAVLDTSRVAGNIRTSRIVYDSESTALYVAAQDYPRHNYGGPVRGTAEATDAADAPAEGGAASSTTTEGPATVVQSYAITADSTIEARTRLDLGGYVSDIQATPRVLMVAHNEWHEGEQFSRVSVVDISSTSGTMVEGDDVAVKGRVSSKHNMNFYKGVLRVVSGGTDWENRINYVETFDATDLAEITPIDEKTFGKGENLFATLFLGNKAFFVTYLRVDPFHAFEITDEGFITERSEYIVSGWNDFFRPVFEETRLVGIGVDDAGGDRTMAVSLYDITDLTNPEPMLARAEVRASGWSWSEARWDDRAFSVLEGAVEATAKDGETVETGLVLLPFSGWDENDERYVAAVQIFTFSDGTLTQRGYMEHGTPVRRSFLAKPTTPANLSEQELSLFNCADPDAPVELGRVELSPSYSDFFVQGDYGVRLRDSSYYYYWWGSRQNERPPATLETVPRAGDPDTSEPVAKVDVPADSRLIRTGDLVVAMNTRWDEVEKPEEPVEGEEYKPRYVTSVVVYDYSNPANPQVAGKLETDEISQGGYYGYGYRGHYDIACYDCGYWGYGGVEAYPLGGDVVFVERTQENKLLGEEEVCNTYPNEDGRHYPDGETRPDTGSGSSETPSSGGGSSEGGEGGDDGETDPDDPEPTDPEPTDPTEEPDPTDDEPKSWYSGNITCRSLDGAEPVCTGEIQLCTYTSEETYEYDCEPVDPETIETHTNCWTHERRRYWQHFSFRVLDLSDPSTPTLGAAYDMPKEQEAVGVFVNGRDVYASWLKPFNVESVDRPVVQHWFTRVDFSDAGAPAADDPVNIPGSVVAVGEDGVIFTRDYSWVDDKSVPSVNRLKVDGGLAWLQARYEFEGEHLNAIMFDRQGHLLVSHQTGWGYYYDWGYPGGGPEEQPTHQLAIYDAAAENMPLLSDPEMPLWASLRLTAGTRALLSVPGGLLVYNYDDASAPYPQSYFASQGWPSRIVADGDDVWFAAGRYGVVHFDLGTHNILQPVTDEATE